MALEVYRFHESIASKGNMNFKSLLTQGRSWLAKLLVVLLFLLLWSDVVVVVVVFVAVVVDDDVDIYDRLYNFK